MALWENSMKEEPDFKPLRLKNGLYMLYDHIMMNGGRIIHNEGTWGDGTCVDSRRVTKDDMERFCIHGDKNCRITDMGKKVVTIIMPNQKPFFLCGYHTLEHSLLERYTEQGYRVINREYDNAHP